MALNKHRSNGCSDFETLINNNGYYIDHTKFIENFINLHDAATLITRPRGFGKSLTMSVLKNFLSIDYKNLENPTKKAETLFKDLYISSQKELCAKYMGQYPVISLSFNGIEGSNFQEAIKRFHESLKEQMKDYSFLIDQLTNYFRSLEDHSTESKFTPDKIDILSNFYNHDLKFLQNLYDPNYESEIQSSFLNKLINIFYTYFNKSIILIIDDYDEPLNKALINGYYDEMLSFMRPILGVIKNNRYIYKSIIVGCLQSATEIIFDSTNNIVKYDIGNFIYSKDFGFTENDLQSLLHYYHLEQHYDEIIKRFDGYVIGDARIFCPCDVLNYCKDLQENVRLGSKNYWIDQSSNNLLSLLMNNLHYGIANQLQKLMDSQSIFVDVNDYSSANILLRDLKAHSAEDSSNFDVMPEYSHNAFWTLLYHIGYLTLDPKGKHYKQDNHPINRSFDQLYEDFYTYVKIPNQAIYEVFKEYILTRFNRQNDHNTDDFFKLLIADPSKEENIQLLNHFVSRQLSDYVGIRVSDKQYYYDFLNGFINAYSSLGKIKSVYFNSRDEQGNNRSDQLAFLMQEFESNIGIVIEISTAKEFRFIAQEADNAIAKVKEQKNFTSYVNECLKQGANKIYIYGMSFHNKDCYIKVELIDPNDYIIKSKSLVNIA